MDTLGSLIDKLVTCDMKLWTKQDEVYLIRRMTYEEFKETYFDDEDGFKKFYMALNSATELNFQRNQLIFEIDKMFEALLKASKEELSEIPLSCNPYKTY